MYFFFFLNHDLDIIQIENSGNTLLIPVMESANVHVLQKQNWDFLLRWLGLVCVIVIKKLKIVVFHFAGRRTGWGGRLRQTAPNQPGALLVLQKPV